MIKTEYRQYLQTDHWKTFRRKVYEKIKECGGCESSEKLNIHHLNYNCLYKETLRDVVVLCEVCHNALHNSEKMGFSQKRWLNLHCSKLFKNKAKNARKRIGKLGKINPKRNSPKYKQGRKKLQGLIFVQNISLTEWKEKHPNAV